MSISEGDVMISREKLLENLEKIRASLCCYVGGEKFCDCKYNPSSQSEHTGCPEIRDTIRILKLIPEDTFVKLMAKSENYVERS